MPAAPPRHTPDRGAAGPPAPALLRARRCARAHAGLHMQHRARSAGGDCYLHLADWPASRVGSHHRKTPVLAMYHRALKRLTPATCSLILSSHRSLTHVPGQHPYSSCPQQLAAAPITHATCKPCRSRCVMATGASRSTSCCRAGPRVAAHRAARRQRPRRSAAAAAAPTQAPSARGAAPRRGRPCPRAAPGAALSRRRPAARPPGRSQSRFARPPTPRPRRSPVRKR